MKVFISYAWGTSVGGESMSTLVARIKSCLEEEYRLEVWQDISDMQSGEILAQMANGIEEADVVLIMLTQRYMEKVNSDRLTKDNCKREFMHAVNHKSGRIIPLVLEQQLTSQSLWTGRFGIGLGEVVFQTMLSMDDFDKMMLELSNKIRDVGSTTSRIGLKDKQHIRGNVFKLPSNFNPLTIARSKAIEYVEGTRMDVVQGVESWFQTKLSKNNNRILVFLGPAGYGKSVIMAMLCHRGGILKENQGPMRKSRRFSLQRWFLGGSDSPFVVGAAHFFKHDDKRANDVRTCFKSIANQLASVVPGLREELETLDTSNINSDDLRLVFDQVLADPLQKVPECHKMVVILDALDEVNPEQKDELLEIITQDWQTKTPAWLGLVVSSRPEDPVKNELERYKPFVLDISSMTNRTDMVHYLNMKLQPYMKSEKDLEEAVKLLDMRSEGLFLYASFIQHTLNEYEKGQLTAKMIRDTDEFPDGLDGIYRQYFTRFLVGPLENDHTRYVDFFAAMVVARSPLPEGIVGQILNFEEEDELDDFLRHAEQLVVVENGSVRFVHKSMTDFLCSKKRAGKVLEKLSKTNARKPLYVKPERGHQVLAKILLEMESTPYALAHMVYHLTQAEMVDQVFEHLVDFSWVLAVVKAGEQMNLIVDMDKIEQQPIHVSDVVLTLRLGQEALAHEPDQLPSQLYGRIPDPNHEIFKSMEKPNCAWLKPVSSSLASTRTPLVAVFEEHTSSVRSVAVEGNMIVSGSWDKTVRVWNWKRPNRGTIILEGHTDWVNSVAIEGDWIVSGGKDKTVRLWNWKLPKDPSIILPGGHDDEVNSVALDGGTIVSGSDDTTVRIWRNPKEPPLILRNNVSNVTSVAIDGDVVVSGSLDDAICVWDLRRPNDLPLLFNGGIGDILTVALQGDLVVSGSDDKMVRVWNWRNPKKDPVVVLKGHRNIVMSVSIKGDIIVSASYDQTVRIWNLKTPMDQSIVFKGHSDSVISVAMEGNFVFSASYDKTVRIWDRSKPNDQPRTSIKGHTREVSSVAIAGDIIVSGSDDRTVRVWNWKKPNDEPIVFEGHETNVTSVAIDKDHIVSGSYDLTVRVWNWKNPRDRPIVLVGHTGIVFSVSIEGTHVASGSNDETVQVWNWTRPDDKPIVLKGHLGSVLSVVLRGDIIVTGGGDQTVRVWFWKNPNHPPPVVFRGHGEPVSSVALAQQWLVSGSYDKTVRVWNWQNPNDQPIVLSGHEKGVNSVAIEGNLVVTGSRDKTVHVWNLESSMVRPYIGFTSDYSVLSVAIDGNMIIVGDDGTKIHALSIET